MNPPLFTPDQWQIVLTVWLGIFGLLWGSFLNVCIYRIPAGLSVITPRSYCYNCGEMVGALDNIPIISYLMLGGTCRHCGSPYSPRYALVELLTGLLFATVGWQFGAAGPTPALLVYCLFIGFMVVATFTDIDHFIIPDSISIGGGLFILGLTALSGISRFWGYPSGFILPIETGWPFEQMLNFPPASVANSWWVPGFSAAVGAIFAAGGLWLVGVIGTFVFRKEAMGMGDIKLMIGMGAILGITHTVAMFFLACVLGSIISVSLMVAGRVIGKREGPLRERYEPQGGAVEEARTARLAEIENADPETEAKSDEPNPGVTFEERAAHHGRLFADASQQKRPYSFRHLPFGPYLAAAAILVLFFSTEVNDAIGNYLELLGAREEAPQVQIRYWTTPN